MRKSLCLVLCIVRMRAAGIIVIKYDRIKALKIVIPHVRHYNDNYRRAFDRPP